MARQFPDKFVVDVTEQDIARGKKGHSNTCAVARGVRRTLKTNKYLGVNSSGELDIRVRNVKYGNNGQVLSYNEYVHYNPTVKVKVIKFIENFDDGKKVKPIRVTFRKVK